MLFMNSKGEKNIETFDVTKVFLLVGILFICHWLMRNTSMKDVSLKVYPLVLGVIWAVMLFLIIISQGSSEQFIYFQF
jgi:alginate O-acetyltransferase complex protein AlgI